MNKTKVYCSYIQLKFMSSFRYLHKSLNDNYTLFIRIVSRLTFDKTAGVTRGM